MNADQRLLVIGIYINSALYLAAVAIFGWLTGHTFAWQAAIATYGLCYLNYLCQLADRFAGTAVLAFILFIASIVTGTLAGLSLLW